MKLTIFTIYLVILVAITMLLGCSSENPICTSSFCLVPRSEVDDPNLIEIDDDKALAFLETLAPDPVTDSADVSIADVVSDTVSNGGAYEGQILTITGTVKELLSSGETLTLETDNDTVTFFVRSWGTPERLASYEVGKPYTFDLYVQDQATAFQQTDKFNVWTDLVESSEPVPITIDTLIADAKAENQRYAQRVITLEATVSSVLDSTIYLKEADLVTSVYIRRSGHADESNYQVNQTYDFNVFVFKVGEWSVLDGRYEIRLGLVRSH